ncbi:MAG: lmo0937 family membrane protein [Chloroflexi bacterium]|nr:MAG: lmo0937 family membrane protein [Chloroflexota bacterium]TMD65227.1 MAG: lmo0937 family membrane protein [Chloroflexota bacterium]
MASLIWTVVVVLFVLWLLGVALQIGGGLIHLLLVLAIIGIIYNLLVGRRAI